MRPSRASRTPKLFVNSFMLLLVLASPAQALEYFANIQLSEYFTDNVTLEPSGFEKSEWVTGIVPTLGADHQGERIEFNLEYSAEAFFYRDVSARNEIYSQFSGIGTFDLIGENLKLFGEATQNQVNVDPTDRLSNSNINFTGNRTDQLIWEVGPQWETAVFRNAEIEAFAYAGKVNYDDPLIQDVDTIRGEFHFGSRGETGSPLTYLLVYGYSRYDYDLQGPPSPESEVEDQNVYLSTRYRLGTNFALLGLVGLDNDLSNPNSSRPNEGRWEAGFAATTGASKIEAAVGHRYFGTTYRFGWDLETDSRVMRLSYSETPGTSESFFLERKAQPGIPDNLLDDTTISNEIPDTAIGRPGSVDRSVQKRADALVFFRTYRGTLAVRGWWEKREQFALAVIDPDLAVNDGDERGFGLNTRWSWELGQRTIANVYAAWRRSELLRESTVVGDGVTTSENDLYRVSFGIENELGQKTFVEFEVGYQDRNSSSTITSNEYNELTGFLALTREF